RYIAKGLLDESMLDEKAAVELIIEQQAGAYHKDHPKLSYIEILAKLKSHISALAKAIDNSAADEFKPTYEAKHKELLGKDAEFSGDAVNVANLIFDNLLQS